MPIKKNSISEVKALLVDESSTGCQLWPGTTNNNGLPVVCLHGITQPVHRTLYELAHPGVSLKGVSLVCRCGNKLCCNPDHYEIAKGNPARRNGKTQAVKKLTEDNVRMIRQGLILGLPMTKLAKTFGVSFVTIRDIRDGHTWAWLQ